MRCASRCRTRTRRARRKWRGCRRWPTGRGRSMDPELVTQMGLMLTQLRYSRRALEDVERSTARYAGFAFASALSAGPSFGAPPMLDGALKVYVVNINDLQPGTGSGGFIEGLLGGVGRFFGGLIGGFVGGTISGFVLPDIVSSMVDLAKRVEH